MHTHTEEHTHYHHLLDGEGELRRPFFAQAFGWLAGSPRTIVDAGSGPGVASCLLAEHYPDAEVVAADADAELIAAADERITRLDLTDRVRTLHTDLPEGIAELRADLIWTSMAVHHLPDQQAALDSFAGRLRPGGVLAVVEGGLPRRYLPRDIGIGRPGLQARMDAAMEDFFDTIVSSVPFVDDWPAALRRAGLDQVRSRTFVYEHLAPLADWQRRHLLETLRHRREQLRDALSDEDNATWDVLLDENGQESLLRRPDVFVLGASTVYAAMAQG